MIPTRNIASIFGGATAICFVFGLSSAVAGDKCAIYGPDFTAVEGSDTCIRIGGHVRVEAGNGNLASSANNGWTSGSTRPASLQSSSDTHIGASGNGLDFPHPRVRLPQGALGYAEPR